MEAGTASDGARAAALGALYASARMPIVVLRPTGQFVAANPAALARYGFSIEELRSMRIHDFVAEKRDVDADLACAMKGTPVPLTRRPHRTKDGTILSVLPSAFPMTIDGESVLVSFLQDVTSLDAAEQQAREAREEARELELRTRALRAELLAADRLASVGRIASEIAHEVNNPAALVMLNLGILRDRIQGADVDGSRAEEWLAMVDDCLEAMGRIRDIVRDVKGFGAERPSAPVDLSRLAAGVIRMVQLDSKRSAGDDRRPAAAHYLQIDARLDPEVFANVRGSRVSQVLTNLLLNAAQATAPAATNGASGAGSQPRIVLRTFREGADACIEVSDTGPGVPTHLAERIFEPFFTTRGASGGTGLGLWLARGIVEEEGGTLALFDRSGSESTAAEGHAGAIFRVSLPASSR